MAAALWGSAEKAFRRSILILLACSFDVVLSCLGLRAFCVIDDLRGLALCIGGRVEDLPGGDRANVDGRSSRGRAAWYGGTGCG